MDATVRIASHPRPFPKTRARHQRRVASGPRRVINREGTDEVEACRIGYKAFGEDRAHERSKSQSMFPPRSVRRDSFPDSSPRLVRVSRRPVPTIPAVPTSAPRPPPPSEAADHDVRLLDCQDESMTYTVGREAITTSLYSATSQFLGRVLGEEQQPWRGGDVVRPMCVRRAGRGSCPCRGVSVSSCWSQRPRHQQGGVGLSEEASGTSGTADRQRLLLLLPPPYCWSIVSVAPPSLIRTH